MEGIIVNFRRGRKTQTTNQMIIMVKYYDKNKAQSLVGKEVIYTCEGKSKKQIKGKVSATHGNKGVVRAIFERGMPGQSIGQKLEIK